MSRERITRRQKNIARLLRDKSFVYKDKLKSERMKMNYFKLNKDGFVGLLELILVLAIILFIGSKIFNAYFKGPDLDRSTQKMLSEQQIDTTNYKTILESAKTKVEEINKGQDQRLNALGRIR